MKKKKKTTFGTEKFFPFFARFVDFDSANIVQREKLTLKWQRKEIELVRFVVLIEHVY